MEAILNIEELLSNLASFYGILDAIMISTSVEIAANRMQHHQNFKYSQNKSP
jgi:hypothetical protein